MTKLLLVVGILTLSLPVGAEMEGSGAAAPSASEAAESAGQITKLVITTGVQNREPVDEVPAGGVAAEKVYCWVKAEFAQTPTTIKHVWYLGGEKQSEVTLNITSSPFRTWSNKTVIPGQWKVEVVAESGTVLYSKDFTVLASATQNSGQ